MKDASGRFMVPGDIIYEAPTGWWAGPHNSLFPRVFVRPEVPLFARPQDARSGWFGRPGTPDNGTVSLLSGEYAYPTKAEAVRASMHAYVGLADKYAAWLAELEANDAR